ncbi:hypothetical protein ABFY09_07780 [Marinomonas sp. 5E14-1]|uniref:hypothetical protein n=1 Tax=Marinomonas sp. 5E14-1 TaxID=3153922 RepID=UPI0032638B9E
MPNSHGFPNPAPVTIAAPNLLSPMETLATNFDVTIEKSQHFHQHYQGIAIHKNYLFLNYAGILQPSEADDIHLDSSENEQLARTLLYLE